MPWQKPQQVSEKVMKAKPPFGRSDQSELSAIRILLVKIIQPISPKSLLLNLSLSVINLKEKLIICMMPDCSSFADFAGVNLQGIRKAIDKPDRYTD